MVKIDVSGDEPVRHTTFAGVMRCPLCNFSHVSTLAFMQHMWLKHKRRHNPVTAMWEKVRG